ncbi:hypothetical protein M514_07091 [Trichuris suis]|uniref:Tc1-like transposase DDE domain-containing protein n=1 Tax=Trichuris suis TaxID=68888 RepID=A0A085NPN3_9BILA|nr:hypothetical protein M513_07091 [Trichuris suis]KFD71429.1 hypothetical protein M514_07091 [Trichuris suis]
MLDVAKILWIDEAIFKLNSHVNRHDIIYWSVANPRLTLEREVNSPRFVVWAGVWSCGMLGPFSFDGNVTADSYLKMITDKVMPYVKDMDLMRHQLTTLHLCGII